MNKKPWYLIYIAVFFVLLWFDRFTKNLVMTNMEVGDAIPSADAFIAIRYTINTGVSFSMLEGHTGVLLAVQSVLLVAVAAAFVITYRKIRRPVLQTGLCWIAAGGAGNLIDRAAYGYVVDFISVGTFPVWNFADMCVVGGCILLAIYLLFVHPKHDGAALPDAPVSDTSYDVFPDEIDTEVPDAPDAGEPDEPEIGVSTAHAIGESPSDE